MWVKLVEVIFFLSWIINAFLFIPQIILLYKKKDASEVSLLMFMCFNLIQIVTIFHGYIHKDYLLVLGFALSLLTSGTVTSLIIIYRNNKLK